MPSMTTEASEFRFRHHDKMLTATVTHFINKSHKIVPDYRVHVKEAAPREREHVYTFYQTKDIYEPIFWFPLHNQEEVIMAKAVAAILAKKQLELNM